MTDARPPVIVVGGSANALSIARALGRKGVQVHGLGVPAAVTASRFMHRIDTAGEASEATLAEALLGPTTDGLRGAVVLAGSDVGITVLARHRAALLDRFRLDVSDVDAQTAMLDKLTTYEHATAAGVPTPLYWKVDGPADIERNRDEFVYPLIVKPLLSHEYQAAFPGRTKFRVARGFDELVAEYRTLAQAGLGVLLTEQIPGPDDLLCSYYTYLDASGTATFDFTKRILRRHPPGMGLASYHITDWNPEVRDVALRLFKSVGLRGLANAEFKRDERDGLLKLIECNARFTAANGLVAAAGLDLAEHVYARVLGIPHELPSRYAVGRRLLSPVEDVRSFLALRRAKQLTTGRWLRSLAHPQVFPYLAWDDPAPALSRARQRVRKAFADRFGR